ncbi:hypothetical protein QBC45DRAFT_426888 [Copromyces sp. CBS 386.78]|nr:hypothetical protein QBC45DRAFT_426888 [Copromyces sp. CBS 386.78]
MRTWSLGRHIWNITITIYVLWRLLQQKTLPSSAVSSLSIITDIVAHIIIIIINRISPPHTE